jgi:hypothetical protein
VIGHRDRLDARKRRVRIDLRRKGIRGFGRFAALWAGFPASFLWVALVKDEGRRDREARGLRGRSDDARAVDH